MSVDISAMNWMIFELFKWAKLLKLDDWEITADDGLQVQAWWKNDILGAINPHGGRLMGDTDVRLNFFFVIFYWHLTFVILIDRPVLQTASWGLVYIHFWL